MTEIIARHRQHWTDRSFVRSAVLSGVFLAVSLAFNRVASDYATLHAGNFVQDLLLDNLPVFNVDIIVTDGAVLFGLYIAVLLLAEPKKIPFVIKSIALFVLIRAGFITFTHLGTLPEHSYLDPTDLFRSLVVGGDYFFSGHTGMPFLLALIFWKERRTRIAFLAISVIFATAVILGHLHYSIDVFAAYFITYSIYALAKDFFRSDHARFHRAERI